MFFTRCGVSILIDGNDVPIFVKEDRMFIAGIDSKPYAVAVDPPLDCDTEVVLAVDGLNQANGKRIAPEQNGLVLPAGTTYTFKGWRISRENVAAFEFGKIPKSYAAARKCSDSVGQIEVFVYSGWRLIPNGKAKTKRSEVVSDLGTVFGSQIYDPVQSIGFRRHELIEHVVIGYASEANLKSGGVDLSKPLSDGDYCEPPEGWDGN